MPESPALTPQQRTLRARLAAHASWAKTADPAGRTAPARRAALDRFERLADPDGTLAPPERARRAAHLRKAEMARLALASARARQRRRAGRDVDVVATEAGEATGAAVTGDAPK
jgi:hypothetical protein